MSVYKANADTCVSRGKRVFKSNPLTWESGIQKPKPQRLILSEIPRIDHVSSLVQSTDAVVYRKSKI